MFEFLFWTSLATAFYVYFGFALLLYVAGRVLNRKVGRGEQESTFSVIIAAYNEQEHIGARLDNLLSLDRADRLEIEVIVASDGSTDATEEIVSGYDSSQVRLLRLPRRGKLHALNAAVAVAKGEILVFSDANTMFERRALLYLSENFKDPAVGGVAGNKVYHVPESGESTADVEKIYWNYDKWLKSLETLTGSTVSADGAIYAIRRSLYAPLETTAVTDDFSISTGVVAQGYRLVFDPRAIAYEAVIEKAEREFSRKVRLMTRGLRGVVMRRALLNPFKYGFYSILLLTHKLLRRILALFFFILFLSNLPLVTEHVIYGVSFAGQLLFYLLAFVGMLSRSHSVGSAKILSTPFYFCMANLAAFIAFLNLIRGEKIERWEPQRHGTK